MLTALSALQELQNAPDGQEAMELAVESLVWVGASALLVSSRLYMPATDDAGEEEQARRPPSPPLPASRARVFFAG